MIFFSLQFIILFVITFLIYWKVSCQYRKYILFICNIIFLLSSGIYVLAVAVLEMFISFFCAMSYLDKKHSSKMLITGILFLAFSMLIIKLVVGHIDGLYIPLGFSYYTLKGIGYLVDIKTDRALIETNLIDYAVAFLFFPCFSSGPIVGIKSFKDLNIENVSFSYDKSIEAIRLIIWGLYKKIVVADNLSVYVNSTYSDLYIKSGFVLVCTALMYSIQLYCDFSGYCDIAVGLARLFGLDINKNFNLPYFSISITEFWRRWNTSLSHWFRDYIYIPVGGNKYGVYRKCFGVLLVFIASSIWHGFTMNYFIWGLLNASIIIIETMFYMHKKIENPIIKSIKRLFTFVLITLLWIPFRLESVADIKYFLSNCFVGFHNFRLYIESGIGAYGQSVDHMLGTIVAPVCILILIETIVHLKETYPNRISFNNKVLCFFDVLIIIFILLLHSTGEVAFIYFNF